VTEARQQLEPTQTGPPDGPLELPPERPPLTAPVSGAVGSVLLVPPDPVAVPGLAPSFTPWSVVCGVAGVVFFTALCLRGFLVVTIVVRVPIAFAIAFESAVTVPFALATGVGAAGRAGSADSDASNGRSPT
jgi:hypothetical protein